MVNQVIMRSVDRDHAWFEAVPNPLNRASISFENRPEHVRIPRLGSEDLIRIAEIAARSGFKVEAFELVDSTMSRLPEGRNNRASEQLLRSLKSGAENALRLLLLEYPTLSVSGISLVDEEARRLTIRRNGVVQGEQGTSPVDVLSSAWKELRFA